eukprot:701663_1
MAHAVAEIDQVGEKCASAKNAREDVTNVRKSLDSDLASARVALAEKSEQMVVVEACDAELREELNTLREAHASCDNEIHQLREEKSVVQTSFSERLGIFEAEREAQKEQDERRSKEEEIIASLQRQLSPEYHSALQAHRGVLEALVRRFVEAEDVYTTEKG